MCNDAKMIPKLQQNNQQTEINRCQKITHVCYVLCKRLGIRNALPTT